MKLSDLQHRLRALGARPQHARRVLRRWLSGRSLRPDGAGQAAGRALPADGAGGPAVAAGAAAESWPRPSDSLPRALIDALPALDAEWRALASVRSEHPGEDGSARLLVDLADGQAVESVLLPRDGVCVSTQVGCAVGCRFCMTGRDGLLRQVGSAEIVAQVVRARERRPVKKVVFMGMGEPAHNLDNVCEAIEFLGTFGDIGHKNLVFSTVGDPRVFERLPAMTVKPALALSLHTTKADLREHLLPRAPRYEPADLVAAGQAYARATGYPIQYQWTLIEGVNDGDDELQAVARLLAGQYAVMNFIPFNAVPDLPYARPSWERAAEMARWLHQRGVLTKLRRSAGQDVDGGCGQLRARVQRERTIPIRAG